MPGAGWTSPPTAAVDRHNLIPMVKLPRRLAFALILLGAPAALAQLVPDRLYYGINRPIPMQVVVPDGKHGDARIDVFVAGDLTPAATSFVAKGGVDLASLFPSLWTRGGAQHHLPQR